MATAIASARGRPASRFQIHTWKESGTGGVTPEPHSININVPSSNKVPVVYYLTRNGQLEHPHFMEVPLSSPHGLYLRDIIERLNLLRGRGMTDLYSWSCKRSYKNGFVWHDLGVNDLVYPACGQEYILKGSELLHCAIICKCDDDENGASIIARRRPPNNEYDSPVLTRGRTRRNQSYWTAADFNDYCKVYREVEACDPGGGGGGGGGRAGTDASTQTEDLRSRRRAIMAEEEDKMKPSLCTEMRRGEISVAAAAWNSSSETLGSLLKGDWRLGSGGEVEKDGAGCGGASGSGGRLRSASSVMQLIWCKDCGASCLKGEEIDQQKHSI